VPSPLARCFSAGFRELVKVIARDDAESASNSSVQSQNLERACGRAAMVESPRWRTSCRFWPPFPPPPRFWAFSARSGASWKAFPILARWATPHWPTVAPGIVDALVTTPLGLIAPFRHHCLQPLFAQVRLHVADIEAFANDFQNIAHRKFLP
jgi:hypothetical protein